MVFNNFFNSFYTNNKNKKTTNRKYKRSQHRKYAETHSIIRTTSHQQPCFTSTLNSQNQGEMTNILGTLSVCSVSQRATGLKIARSWRKWVNAKRNSKRHIDTFFAWIAATLQEPAAERVGLHAQDARGRIIDLYVRIQEPLLHPLERLYQLPSAR